MFPFSLIFIFSLFLKEPVFPNQKLKKQPSFEKFVLAMLFCLACRGITRSAEFKCKLTKINYWFLQSGGNKKTCGTTAVLHPLRTRYIYFCRSGGNQSAHCCVSRENLYTHTQNLSLHYSLHKTRLQTHVRYWSVCSGGTSVWHARGKGGH